MECKVITIDGAGSSWTSAGMLKVGDSGTGSLTVSQGGLVNVGSGTLQLATNAGSAGTLNIGAAAGGSAVAGGVLNAAPVTTGSGSGSVQFNTDATSSNPYYFTRDGSSTGVGVAIAGATEVINTAGFNVLKGNSSTTGAASVNGGSLLFEIDSDGHGGFLNSTLVFDPMSQIQISGADIHFDFLNGADAFAFYNAGLFTMNSFFTTSSGAAFGSQYDYATVFQNTSFLINLAGANVTEFDPVTGGLKLSGNPNSVPDAASTFALLALGLSVLLVGAHRRRTSLAA